MKNCSNLLASPGRSLTETVGQLFHVEQFRLQRAPPTADLCPVTLLRWSATAFSFARIFSPPNQISKGPYTY
jgi:hypothetical protein